MKERYAEALALRRAGTAEAAAPWKWNGPPPLKVPPLTSYLSPATAKPPLP